MALTLHEFNERQNRMSTSSRNNFGSFRTDCGIVTNDASDGGTFCTKSQNRTLSKHWQDNSNFWVFGQPANSQNRYSLLTCLMSLIQAAFSCIVNAYKCTSSGGPTFFSITNLKSWFCGHEMSDCRVCGSHILLPLLVLRPLLARISPPVCSLCVHVASVPGLQCLIIEILIKLAVFIRIENAKNCLCEGNVRYSLYCA